MIRFVGTKPDGTPFLILGVDRENIRRLIAGKPIICTGESVGIDRDVVVMFGETLQDILDDLKLSGVPVPSGQGTKQ